jgi:hypothetical protein
VGWQGVNPQQIKKVSQMSIYTLFHIDPESAYGRTIRFDGMACEVKKALNAGDYKIAGVFDVASNGQIIERLDDVFDATQHIHESWTTSRHNPNVKPIWHAENPRSTSVGDVILDPWGLYWIVSNMGFTRLYMA